MIWAHCWLPLPTPPPPSTPCFLLKASANNKYINWPLGCWQAIASQNWQRRTIQLNWLSRSHPIGRIFFCGRLFFYRLPIGLLRSLLATNSEWLATLLLRTACDACHSWLRRGLLRRFLRRRLRVASACRFACDILHYCSEL